MNQNVLYFIISFAFAFLIAGWFYYDAYRKSKKIPSILFILRTISLFLIFLLLFNPSHVKERFLVVKPSLLVFVDNSLSIKNLGKDTQVPIVVEKIQQNKSLQDKFEVQFIGFGEKVSPLDSLNFKETETDFSKIFHATPKTKNPQIWITDGNQTKGRDYTYTNVQYPIYPIVVGDTLHFKDLILNNLQTNTYTFLANTFPVEVFAQMEGSTNEESILTVTSEGKIVHQQKIVFKEDKTSKRIVFSLPATSVGTHYYKLSLSPLKGEKNTINNYQSFSIEVIDQQTKVLIASSINHPDLGVFKESIEQNEQRKADLSISSYNDLKITDYQLIILYQPDAEMQTLITDIKKYNIPSLFITGTHTNWQFLNKMSVGFSKNTTELQESYRPVFNNNFSLFNLKDFGWHELPPLEDAFGSVEMNSSFETLFFQKVGKSTLEEPLVAFYEEANVNRAVIFGEGIWKWHMMSSKELGSSDYFDQFIDAIIQRLVSGNEKENLIMDYAKLLYSNQPQNISATYYNANYQNDTKVQISYQLVKIGSKEKENGIFSLDNKSYQLRLNNLLPGDYRFTAQIKDKNISKSLVFKVLEYSVESQFARADYQKLIQLASQTGGFVSYENSYDKLIEQLLVDKSYFSTQKSEKKREAYLDWEWLLMLIIVSLSAEWFVRKWHGLI